MSLGMIFTVAVVKFCIQLMSKKLPFRVAKAPNVNLKKILFEIL
jgi:hypothetical protein